MNQLSQAIYHVLRRHISSSQNQYVPLTYQELVIAVAGQPSLARRYRGLSAQDARLDNALKELVQHCRRKRLPALPAMSFAGT
jgi:hypothetical protein